VLITLFSRSDDIRKCLIDMNHGWTKNAFWGANKKKCRKRCKFASPLIFITLMSYLCSQWTPNYHMKYFMLDRSIYRLFVLNRGWTRESLQIMIFVYVCSTWTLIELNTCFETWVTKNDVNIISWFHISYLITLMAYL
jgi:hypothetical protein